ncbi:hypothetical protein OLX23_09560 [Novosphingobium sp. JCM 18896]|nr:hypothetical protein [Novosphingobium sp. JCM 18896]
MDFDLTTRLSVEAERSSDTSDKSAIQPACTTGAAETTWRAVGAGDVVDQVTDVDGIPYWYLMTS